MADNNNIGCTVYVALSWQPYLAEVFVEQSVSPMKQFEYAIQPLERVREFLELVENCCSIFLYTCPSVRRVSCRETPIFPHNI